MEAEQAKQTEQGQQQAEQEQEQAEQVTPTELRYLLSIQKENIELQNRSFKTMQTLMKHIAQASENFLALERLRLQEAKENLTNSTSLPEDITRLSNNSDNQPNTSINLDVTKALNDSLTALMSNIEGSKNPQYHVKRNYTLAQKGDINIWLDKLKSELGSKDLLDAIDESINVPQIIDERTLTRRRETVREIITSRLDDCYYKRVLNIKDPKAIIQCLREAKRVENNVTHTSVRTKLYQLKLQHKESIDNFWGKFDNLVVEYECCENSVKLSEEEKRSAFYQAVSNTYPEVRTADLIHKRITGKSMTLEDLKSHLLEIEAEKRSAVSQTNVQNIHANQAKRVKTKCYRCNQVGHFMDNCPLNSKGDWYGYLCKAITNHNANTCSKNTNNSRGRGRGRRGRTFSNRGGFKSSYKPTQRKFQKEANFSKEGNKRMPQAN